QQITNLEDRLVDKIGVFLRRSPFTHFPYPSPRVCGTAVDGSNVSAACGVFTAPVGWTPNRLHLPTVCAQRSGPTQCAIIARNDAGQNFKGAKHPSRAFLAGNSNDPWFILQ
ncbi:MAG: hypothetical protein V3T19_03310, partial [Acidiferrobacterales bacterium]